MKKEVLLVLKGPAEIRLIGHGSVQYMFEKGKPERVPRDFAEAMIYNCTAHGNEHPGLREGDPLPEVDQWGIVDGGDH